VTNLTHVTNATNVTNGNPFREKSLQGGILSGRNPFKDSYREFRHLDDDEEATLRKL
jgi:hypothetical protein